jgi:penicillin amidase
LLKKLFKKKVVITLLLIVLLLVLTAVGGGYWQIRQSLAVTSGTLTKGVQKPVQILRDEYGVPHIEAENERDLMFAQGYVHAQDRMWQMELSRRTVNGELAEIFGEDLLQGDIFTRTIGFKRIAEETLSRLPASTLENLQAYADGVNAYLNEGKLPIEYKILGVEPKLWTPVDSLGITKYMAWDLGGNMMSELLMREVSRKLGEEKAISLIPEYAKQMRLQGKEKTAQAPAPSVESSTDGAHELLTLIHKLRKEAIPGESLGSNNWVVSGKKSVSGKPLLANDMHLAFQAPSTFYQNHLRVPDQYNVTGVIFPGVPGVIVGHNEHIAWGFTNTGPDVQDLYIMKQNPGNKHQFEYNGQYEDAKVIEQVIKVKGKDEPVRVETVITRHGPIITDVLEETGSSVKVAEPLALKWTASEPSDEMTALFEMNRAKNWTEFERALRHFTAPTQNVVYADTEGNIAMRTNGHIPIRKKGNGLMPVPGWTDEYEWKGYIPWEELPFVWNPEEGFIATANNKVVDDRYPYLITYEWADDYRYQRIRQMLQEKDKLSLQDMERMQVDWKNLQAVAHRDLWLKVLDQQKWNETEQKAWNQLREWLKNPIDDPRLAGPIVFHSTLSKAMERLFVPQLGDELYGDLNKTGLAVKAFDEVYLGGNSSWLAGTGLTREQALIDGFRDAVAFLKEELGSNPDKWTWGALHTITFEHPLGGFFPANLLFNDGPHPLGGSHATVGAAGYSRKQRPYIAVAGAPWRFVIDLGYPVEKRPVGMSWS